MPARNHYYYLSCSRKERSWGLYVTGVGHSIVAPHGKYPPTPHPAGYAFRWERGRILDEYGLLHIAKGSGVFESACHGGLKLSAGDSAILIPDEWHRYKPDADTGWEEYWVTFQGQMARYWSQEKIICPDSPLLSTERQGARSLSTLYEDLLAISGPQDRSRALERAAACHLIMACAISSAGESHAADPPRPHIHLAGDYLRSRSEEDIDLEALAKRFAMSYSSFRRNFAKYFGVSPDRFHQNARIARVKQFLMETELPLKTIASRMNYSSEFYMMHVFKRHTGSTPTEWRERRGRQ